MFQHWRTRVHGCPAGLWDDRSARVLIFWKRFRWHGDMLSQAQSQAESSCIRAVHTPAKCTEALRRAPEPAVTQLANDLRTTEQRCTVEGQSLRVFSRPRMVALGVGGAGGNTINNLVRSLRQQNQQRSADRNSELHLDPFQGLRLLAANTDAQALSFSLADRTFCLGERLTAGLGAGANPSVGREAARACLPLLMEEIRNAHILFLTAGLGGGTGTGAAPVIAQAARAAGVLTIAVVSTPFAFEGRHRMRLAEQGLDALEPQVDTIVTIPNQNLFRLATNRTTLQSAFQLADDVLCKTIRSVTDLMYTNGFINLDFADLDAITRNAGRAVFGMGEASGCSAPMANGNASLPQRSVDTASSPQARIDRGRRAIELALNNPLLDGISLGQARGALISISGGRDLLLDEVNEIASLIRDRTGPHANIIFGSAFDESLTGTVRVSVIITAGRTLQTTPAPAAAPFSIRSWFAKASDVAEMSTSRRQKVANETFRETSQNSESLVRPPAGPHATVDRHRRQGAPSAPRNASQGTPERTFPKKTDADKPGRAEARTQTTARHNSRYVATNDGFSSAGASPESGTWSHWMQNLLAWRTRAVDFLKHNW